MEEDQRLIVNPDSLIIAENFIIIQIPGGQVDPIVLQDDYTFKAFRPII